MQRKSITINDNEKLLEGFNSVADAVKQSLGSEGGYAVMKNDFDNPTITKDGFSIAKKIFFEDDFMNIGATLAKQVCATTLIKAQDSTTSSLTFAQALVKHIGSRYNKKVEQGIDEAFKEITESLDALSREINDETVRKIATISANNKKELGDLVYKAYKSISKGGIINVVEADQDRTTLKISKGMKLDKGFSSPFFVNNQNKACFEADNCLVLVYEGILEGDEIVQEFITENSNKPILIVAERFSDDVSIRMADYAQRKVLNICLVAAPEYDLKRKAILEDLALYTGGEVFLRGSSTEVKAGTVKRVLVEEGSTSITQENVSQEVKDRIEELRNQLEVVTDKKFIQTRVQNLEGSSATIFVGGTTPVEKKETFDLLDDAVGSVNSSLKEGWICGGGATMVYISSGLDTKFSNSDVQYGYDAMREAIKAPFQQICTNAGRAYKDYLPSFYNRVFRNKVIDDYGIGYNAITDEVSNLIEDGVIDSKYSIRVALENAKSVAKLLSNVRVVIT